MSNPDKGLTRLLWSNNTSVKDPIKVKESGVQSDLVGEGEAILCTPGVFSIKTIQNEIITALEGKKWFVMLCAWAQRIGSTLQKGSSIFKAC